MNRMVLGSEGRHTGPLTVVGVPDPPAARLRGARGSDEMHALGKKLHDDPEGSALQVCSQLCSSGMEAESEMSPGQGQVHSQNHCHGRSLLALVCRALTWKRVSMATEESLSGHWSNGAPVSVNVALNASLS